MSMTRRLRTTGMSDPGGWWTAETLWNANLDEAMKIRFSKLSICASLLSLLLVFWVARSDAQELQYPVSAVAAADGTIYIADIDAPAIWKLKDGKLEKFFAASKKFRTPVNRPRCLAIDQKGKLLVGDSSTREVYRFDDAGKPVPLTKGGIGIPRAIVVLPSGELMVSDQELHCIWKVPAAGGTPAKFVAVPGVIAMCADNDGNLWVTSAPKHDLRKISPDGKIENVITDGPLQFPQEVAVDDAKTVYIADNYSKAIWKVPLGQKPEKMAEGAPLVSPSGVTRSGDKLIVTDPHAKAIFQVDAAGKVTKLWPAS